MFTKNMSRLFAFMLALAVTGAAAQSSAQYKITENNFKTLKMTVTIPEIQTQDIKTDKGEFTRISMEGFHVSADIGNPELPVFIKMIEIPICADITVKSNTITYTVNKTEELNIHHPVFPAQPSYSKSHEGPVELVINEETYKKNEFYGFEKPVTVEKVGIMRNMNMATIYVYPVSYNPVTKEMVVCKSIDIEVRYEGADFDATQKMKELHGNGIFSALESQVINPIHFQSKDVISSAPIKYLIVSPRQFESTLQPLVEWKKRKGFIVVEAYTDQAEVGTTTTTIKNYITSHYTNATASDPAPTYVLFVGDVAQIPAFSGTTGTHPTDLYYCDWTGDNLPDCYYGRFSAETVAQLTPQVEKTLVYEQYTMSDPSYLDDAVLVAGADSYWSPTHANGQINYLNQYYVNAAYGYTNIHKYLHPASSYAATIRSDIGKGVGFANYTAHCSESGWSDPAFEVSHVSAMSNNDKYGLMIGSCCQSNKFDVSVCFGEALLRASQKGAVGYIGGSDNTYWDEDYYWSVGLRSSIIASPTYNSTNLGAYDKLFHTHSEPYASWFTSNGAMMVGGNLAVQSSNSSRKKYYWEIYHLMGDPSIMTWLTQAETMTVIAQSALVVGSNSLQVEAVPYAYVALTHDLEFVAGAFADETGTVTLTFPALTTPGVYELAVSAQNYQTYFTPVTVFVSSGSYVIASGPAVRDPQGNNNNRAEAAERIQWDVTFSNLGVIAASDISAKLTTTSPYITMLEDSILVGNIAANDDITRTGIFAARVDPCVKNGTIATFILYVYDNDEVTNLQFNVPLYAPNMASTMASYVETSGNHDGTVDPGESIDVRIVINNSGQMDAADVRSELVSLYTKAVVETPAQDLGILEAGNNAASIYSVSMGADIESGTIVPLYHHVYFGDCERVDTIYVMLGKAVEDFETAGFTKFEWQNGTYPWVIVNSGAFEGLYAAKSGAIGDNQESTLEITLHVLADDTVSYFRKVSSENNYDFFRFYIDNEQKEQLSGEVAWQKVSFPVSAGLHTFKFEYKKDISGIRGADCAWIDFINLPVAKETGKIVDNNLGIAETKPLSFVVYPNPANNQITVRNGETMLKQVEILDITGKLIHRISDIHDMQVTFNISQLSDGVYFIRVIDETMQNGIQKFIKKQ